MQTKTYTPEFRAEAVKLVLAQGLPLEEAAQRVAIQGYAGQLGQ
jgi:transposase